MITSSCNCGTDLTDFLLQDTDIEITLTNVIEPDVSLSHIKAFSKCNRTLCFAITHQCSEVWLEEVTFKDI